MRLLCGPFCGLDCSHARKLAACTRARRPGHSGHAAHVERDLAAVRRKQREKHHADPGFQSTDLAQRGSRARAHIGTLGGRRLLRAQRDLARWRPRGAKPLLARSEEHTSELQSPCKLVCRLLLEIKYTT